MSHTAKDVATQLKITASAENSAWMAGRATLTAEIINGCIKEVNVATIRADFSNEASLDKVQCLRFPDWLSVLMYSPIAGM